MSRRPFHFGTLFLAFERLLEEAEEVRQVQDAARGGQSGLVGKLGLHEVRGGLGGINADE